MDNKEIVNKIHHMSCIDGMKLLLEDNSIGLIVTSPPYYNAREYSTWDSFELYMKDMRDVFTEAFRVLENHRYIVVNISDTVGRTQKQAWSNRKIPLGAYFVVMLEEIGFKFIDNYIWDKGEPQTKRHLGNPQYPFYQYPINCYEYIIVMAKHVKDNERVPCPICNSLTVQNNGQQSEGVLSWECKNKDCSEKSPSGRGKRFSNRSIMMDNHKTDDNYIEEEFIKKWRRDIIKINPVIKTNSNGENKIGHTAPYPTDIPEMAIRYFSGTNDIVLDMFTGSGTSQLVAKQLNRQYIGFEIHKEYVELAEKRINEDG